MERVDPSRLLSAGFWDVGDPQGVQFQIMFKDHKKNIIERKFSNLFVPLVSKINIQKNKNFQKKIQIDLTWLQFWR